MPGSGKHSEKEKASGKLEVFWHEEAGGGLTRSGAGDRPGGHILLSLIGTELEVETKLE